MSTDLDLLSKGLIRLGILVFLFILSPVLITMGFKGLDKFNEAPKIYFVYLLIIIGFATLIFTVYFAFKTFKVIGSSIFNNK